VVLVLMAVLMALIAAFAGVTSIEIGDHARVDEELPGILRG
jgi:hypothetical protein